MKIPRASNSVTVKLRAMSSARLSEQDFVTMLSCQDSSDVTEYIKNNTAYAECLRGFNPGRTYMGQLGTLLNMKPYLDMVKIGRYDRATGGHACDYLIFRQDCMQILQRIRTLGENVDEFYLFSFPDSYRSYTKLDMPGMMKLNTLDELERYLKGSDYEEIIKNLSGSKAHLLIAEGRIHRLSCTKLLEGCRRASLAEGKKELQKTAALIMDCEGLISIYRMKRMSDRSETLQGRFAFDALSGLSPEIIKNVLKAETQEEMAAILMGSPYERLFASSVKPDIVANRMTAEHCKSRLRLTTNPDEAALCYFELSKLEINDIINVFEGIRCGLDTESIKDLIYSYSL